MHGGRDVILSAISTGVIGLTAFTLASCAGTPSAPALVARAEPRTQLESLHARQLARPDKGAMSLPAPPGVDPSSIAELPASERAPNTKAMLSVDEAIAQLPPPSSIPSASSEQADPPTRLEATKVYSRARLRLLDGKPADALVDLETAARMDPASPQIWRELAKSQISLGRRAGAVASLRQAAALGIDDPEVYAILARQALQAGEPGESAALLIRARASSHIQSDPSLSAVVNADLGEALYRLGYLAASATLTQAALEVPPQVLATPRPREEAAELYRRRAELWHRTGNTWCRLAHYERALQAYEQADAAASLDPGTTIPYAIFANLRLGRSAAAAMSLLDQIKIARGLAEDRQIPLLRLLSRSTQVGDLLGEALIRVGDELDDAPPSIHSRLARVMLAATTPARGRVLLIDFLREHPSDADAVGALFASYTSSEFGPRLEAALTLARHSPAHAPMLADILLACGTEIDATLARLERDHASPGAVLLLARLQLRLGHHQAAASSITSVDPALVEDPGTLATLVDLGVSTGRWDYARRSLDRLNTLESPDAGLWRANALRTMQRFDEAYRSIARSLNADNASVDWLLRAADLAARVSRPEEARAYLQQAVARDRYDERAYQALIELHSPGGALHDDEAAIGVARALRQAVESSRVIRGLSAQELVSRSLWSQAEPLLLSLLDRELESPAVLELLVTAWERAAASRDEMASRGEALLRERLAQRPDSAVLATALARVLAARGQAKEALAIVDDRLARHPIPELSRVKEHLLREFLDDAAQADRLAAARLENGPRTIDAATELATLLATQGEFDRALSTIAGWVPQGASLTPDQASRLLALLASLTPERLASRSPEAAAGAMRLFDLVVQMGVPMQPPMHLLRLTLLAQSTPDETARLLEAIRQTGEQHPQLSRAALGQVLQLLSAAQDISPMLRLMGLAATTTNPIDAELIFEWFRQTALRGDLDDARHLVEHLTDPPRIEALLDRLSPGAILPASAASSAAELAYLVGNVMAAVDRDDQAMDVYRYALTLQPGHGWSSNNLGYMLLERGGDLAEVERLLLDAWKSLPHDANVTDSLAWLRYKQGILNDVVDETGRVITPGAVSLLRQAAMLFDGAENPTVQDHLGDALWAAGHQDEARRAWEAAARLYAIELGDLPRAGSPDDRPSRRASLEADLTRVRKKLGAAEAGLQPAIAPRGPIKP